MLQRIFVRKWEEPRRQRGLSRFMREFRRKSLAGCSSALH